MAACERRRRNSQGRSREPGWSGGARRLVSSSLAIGFSGPGPPRGQHGHHSDVRRRRPGAARCRGQQVRACYSRAQRRVLRVDSGTRRAACLAGLGGAARRCIRLLDATARGGGNPQRRPARLSCCQNRLPEGQHRSGRVHLPGENGKRRMALATRSDHGRARRQRAGHAAGRRGVGHHRGESARGTDPRSDRPPDRQRRSAEGDLRLAR